MTTKTGSCNTAIQTFAPVLQGKPLKKVFRGSLKRLLFNLGCFLSVFFVSCAAGQSAVLAQETYSPPAAASAREVTPQWRPLTEATEAAGFFSGQINTPRLEFWALRLDMAAGELEIVVSGGGAADGGRNTVSAKVSSFVADNGLLAGVNAVPFDISTSEEGLPILNVGIVVSGGQVIAAANPRFYALVWYNDGSVSIVSQSQLGYTGNIQNAVGGFHQILKDGEFTPRTAGLEARHPRTAAGICASGRFLYLLVIDGRRRGSIGATEAETAFVLRQLGSYHGINFDGGGSSAMALRGEDGNVIVANRPVHRGFPGRERAVAGSLGIRLAGQGF